MHWQKHRIYHQAVIAPGAYPTQIKSFSSLHYKKLIKIWQSTIDVGMMMPEANGVWQW